MTCAEIIEKHLKDNGFDGLFCSGADCGCKLGRLFPCCESFDTCRPGYFKYEPGDEFDWIIVSEKPKDPDAK